MLGAIGGHFFYLGKPGEGFRRIGFFFICNLYCFYRSWKETYQFIKMTDYEFGVYSGLKKIEGTGTRQGLHEYLNKIHKD